jgi:hypothetical protein
MVVEVDDESFAAYIVIGLIGIPTVFGYALGGLTGCISMLFLALMILPAVLYILGVGMFKRHDDIYG